MTTGRINQVTFVRGVRCAAVRRASGPSLLRRHTCTRRVLTWSVRLTRPWHRCSAGIVFWVQKRVNVHRYTAYITHTQRLVPCKRSVVHRGRGKERGSCGLAVVVGSFVLSLGATLAQMLSAQHRPREPQSVRGTPDVSQLYRVCLERVWCWISEWAPWMQAVLPRPIKRTACKRWRQCGARTCWLVRMLWIHERVLVQPLPNVATECAVTRGRLVL